MHSHVTAAVAPEDCNPTPLCRAPITRFGTDRICNICCNYTPMGYRLGLLAGVGHGDLREKRLCLTEFSRGRRGSVQTLAGKCSCAKESCSATSCNWRLREFGIFDRPSERRVPSEAVVLSYPGRGGFGSPNSVCAAGSRSSRCPGTEVPVGVATPAHCSSSRVASSRRSPP